MDVASYLQKKQNEAPQFRADRETCADCWQPQFSCYCHAIEKFDAKIEFIILIHPIEARRRVATGRMSYLNLANAHILRGSEFAGDAKLNALLAEPGYRNILLSPGTEATNLTGLPEDKIRTHFPQDKKLRIFVLDREQRSTWVVFAVQVCG